MPRLSTGRTRARRRSSGSERVFEDEQHRIWTAYPWGGGPLDVLIFTCVSDSREPPRALAAETGSDLSTLPEEVLRELLTAAPRIGRLM